MVDDSFEKLSRITELVSQQNRLLKLTDSPMMKMIREQERIRDHVDPPALRAFREQQDRLRDLVDPPALRAFREQQEMLRNIADPPALRAFREEQERLRDLMDPPALRAFREHQEMFRGIHEAMKAIPPGITSLASEACKMDLPDISGLVRTDYALASQFCKIDLPDMSALASMTAYARSAQLFSCGSTVFGAAFQHGHLVHEYEKACLASAGITKLVPRIAEPTFKSSGKVLVAGNHFLRSSFEDGAADMVAEIPSEVFRVLDLDTAFPGGAQEVVEKERADLAVKTCDELESFLSNLNPQLVALLQGARAAAVNSLNPDTARHLCISLRELLGHALRQMAPDAQVKAWSQDPTHFNDGRPTRNARIQYLYSPVSQPALRQFIDADIRAAIALFDVLNKGTHVANLGADAAALAVLLNRAEGILLLLLRLGLTH
jgi:hypothetical protein